MASTPAKIIFEKTNGELREMNATVKAGLIPEDKMPTEESQRKSNPDVKVVFDVDKGEWRSFRWDRLRFVNGQIYSEEQEVNLGKE